LTRRSSSAATDQPTTKQNRLLREKGLTFSRLLSAASSDPLTEVTWSPRNAIITSAKGEVIFQQPDVEAPESWSDMAVTVVASRYFRGKIGNETRERSIRELLLRVAGTIVAWGDEQGYFLSTEDAQVFRDELLVLLVRQMASFNSPVWFNVGIEPKPQCSACFILGVDDTMESILRWYYQEGLIFKGGSGSGVNISRLRSAREPLAGGGTASGPVSFMRAADASAGVIKSGGKTRRAAKMVILDVGHPDILDFIRCKALEEKKARALVRAGYDGSFEGEAHSSVGFQNSNHSVRVPDAFMRAVESDENWETRFLLNGLVAEAFPARYLLREIALAAHQCGDPGLQFDTAINSYHTCPVTGPIRASNPCSEYFHVDNSACNLASLRLTAFLDDNLRFRAEEFRQAISVMVTAQEILIDKASYPSDAIARNSHSMRAIGLGYADLGAFLMSRGVPYDSEPGRAWASALTALMTGQAYVQSAKIAAVKGPFPEFRRNRKPMLAVIASHRRNLSQIQGSYLPETMLLDLAGTWDSAVELGKRWGYSNCQVTVLAPTGTVAFMMDCDTTGIEPEIALVKYKSLSGGGTLKIVNGSVRKSLETLGYSDADIAHILQVLENQGTIENIPEIRPEDLSVFDCALRPATGARCISPYGHLKMMAAVQPFLSGGISKTINLPGDTTVEEIEEIFLSAWKMDLKSVSVYRDGCKAVQPLSVVLTTEQESQGPTRRRLPVDCTSVRHKFEIAGQKGYIHTGFYEDGNIGEIFIRMAKEGSTVSGLMDTIATLTSIALQYGVPLEALVNKFSHVRFEPSGMTSNPKIPFAKSLTDYIFRYLGTRFLTREQQEAAGLAGNQPGLSNESNSYNGGSYVLGSSDLGHSFNPQSDAPSCHDCGAIMVRNGSCYKCLNCGATSGCS
jgi:ribonucleoside-diphosphate reductase alpha chain